MSVRVDFFLGLGSRYSYLAAAQADRIERETGCTLTWTPIASPVLISRVYGANSPFASPGQVGPYTPEWREKDMRRWAALLGLTYNPPDVAAIDTAACVEAAWAVSPKKRRAFCQSILHRQFAEGIAADKTFLRDTAIRLGEAPGLFDSALQDGPAKDAHEAALRRAQAHGAFGVPTFHVDGETFWGNDRIALLIHHLRALDGPRTGAAT